MSAPKIKPYTLDDLLLAVDQMRHEKTAWESWAKEIEGLRKKMEFAQANEAQAKEKFEATQARLFGIMKEMV